MIISRMRISVRTGFYVGLAGSLALGLYLFQLWRPGKQVRLHSLHFLEAIESKDWTVAGDCVAESYHDQWGDDRTLLLMRLREVMRYTRNLRFEWEEVHLHASAGQGEWRARVSIEADSNEVTELMKQRINTLETPFQFRWEQQSGKPWDWKLIAVSNEKLELTGALY